MLKFDHMEVHVKDAEKYAIFLQKLFGNGRYKKISENNTFMFLSIDDFHIEIKEKKNYIRPFALDSDIGFCMPCLRMKGANEHLKNIKEVEITNQIMNPDGACFFFKDYEGIDWHIKDYEVLDIYTNI
jgi:hypothetical protein